MFACAVGLVAFWVVFGFGLEAAASYVVVAGPHVGRLPGVLSNAGVGKRSGSAIQAAYLRGG